MVVKGSPLASMPFQALDSWPDLQYWAWVSCYWIGLKLNQTAVGYPWGICAIIAPLDIDKTARLGVIVAHNGPFFLTELPYWFKQFHEKTGRNLVSEKTVLSGRLA